MGASPQKKDRDGLTIKQRAFADAYIETHSSAKAAIAAGYSEKSAEQQGPMLLRVPEIWDYINKQMAKASDKTLVNAEFVLRELARLASVDVGEAFTEDGELKKVREMPLDLRRAISGIERDSEGNIKVKFWSKTAALEMLGKNLKLFTDVVEHQMNSDLADKISEAFARASKV